IAALPAGDKVLILTPFRQSQHRNTREELNILLQKGFSRIYLSSLPSPTLSDATVTATAATTPGETLRIEDLLEMDDKTLESKLSIAVSGSKTSPAGKTAKGKGKAADKAARSSASPGIYVL